MGGDASSAAVSWAWSWVVVVWVWFHIGLLTTPQLLVGDLDWNFFSCQRLIAFHLDMFLSLCLAPVGIKCTTCQNSDAAKGISEPALTIRVQTGYAW
ncbi:hypothetical protein QBC41DRAFT_327282 [Cercophora samala]|uniref:Uncharacterized protein n=1 Tax=Cercophora samala TaxID=330535 RepID=A0AA39Z7R1_9PEZI|nr:hypothetical protein QBC41DRAFT_327282 [Cercophora samala]